MTTRSFVYLLFLPTLAIWIVALVAACDVSPEGARQQKINAEEQTFVFHTPPARTYDMARELIGEKGFTLPPGPPVMDRDIATDWVPGGLGGERFLVRFIRVGPSAYLVHLVGQSRDRDGKIYSRLRWTDLEWELIQRAEPSRALSIAKAANRRADQVHKRNMRRAR